MIVFLDIDGVLNNSSDLYTHGIHYMCCEKAARVQRICHETGAKIVVSSSWRKIHTLDDLRERFAAVGLLASIIGKTPSSNDGVRGHEIEVVLRTYPEHTSYVILDDDGGMLPHQMPRFVKTDFEIGITDAQADEAIRVLRDAFATAP